ncbi:MAG: tyrosine-type recombinase/integrase [Acidimicrobiales bacterium]
MSDLRVFFSVIDKDPVEVTPADVLEFINSQRRGAGDGRVVRLADGGSGMAARTIRRRLASVSGLFNWLVLCGDRAANPVPRGMATRRSGAGGQSTGVPLIRTPRTLPKVLDPGDVILLLGAVRRWRDRAMLEAMVLGGLRCCEVIGLRLEDLQPTNRRVFIAAGKGGHQRLIPMSGQFFQSVSNYLSLERPADASTDALFVSLKGARAGQALSIDGLEQIVRAAKARAGLERATCHQLRHTCLTRLREAGMALEAIQAQAGHRSIESTRVYLHLADSWLAGEYQRASDLIDASVGILR